jgi:hypothetical protein
MTTTGELRAIIEELELVDVGEADSYLDDETSSDEEMHDTTAATLASCLTYISSVDDWTNHLF